MIDVAHQKTIAKFCNTSFTDHFFLQNSRLLMDSNLFFSDFSLALYNNGRRFLKQNQTVLEALRCYT